LKGNRASTLGIVRLTSHVGEIERLPQPNSFAVNGSGKLLGRAGKLMCGLQGLHGLHGVINWYMNCCPAVNEFIISVRKIEIASLASHT
jgi:hypothetical protein